MVLSSAATSHLVILLHRDDVSEKASTRPGSPSGQLPTAYRIAFSMAYDVPSGPTTVIV